MEHRIADIDFNALTAERTFFPSPAAWEDEALYFLMLDRFSDARENGYRDNSGAIVTTGTTPPFQPSDRGNATSPPADRQQWTEAGNSFVGGTLRGLESKIGRLPLLDEPRLVLLPPGACHLVVPGARDGKRLEPLTEDVGVRRSHRRVL